MACVPSEDMNVEAVSSEKKYFVNDVPAEEYYKKFIYRESTYETSEGTSTWYYYLTSEWIEYGVDIHGKRLFKSLDVKLNADYTYIVVVEDIQYLRTNHFGAKEYNVISRKEFNGTWSVVQTEIVLSEFGVGGGIKYNDAHAINMHFGSDCSIPELRNKKNEILRFVSGSGNPFSR